MSGPNWMISIIFDFADHSVYPVKYRNFSGFSKKLEAFDRSLHCDSYSANDQRTLLTTTSTLEEIAVCHDIIMVMSKLRAFITIGPACLEEFFHAFLFYAICVDITYKLRHFKTVLDSWAFRLSL